MITEVYTDFSTAFEGSAQYNPGGSPDFNTIKAGPSDAVGGSPDTVRLRHHASVTNSYDDYFEPHWRFDTSSIPADTPVFGAALTFRMNTYSILAGGATIGLFSATVAAPLTMTIGDWHTGAAHSTFNPLSFGGTDFVTMVLPPSAINTTGYTNLALGWDLAPPVWQAGASEFVVLLTSSAPDPADRPVLTVGTRVFQPGGTLIF